MRAGVIYLLTHMQLAARLVVSIHSLRRWYAGPVTVFTTRPESHEIGELCAADPRLRVTAIRVQERPGRGYTSSYLTKTSILKHSPYQVSAFFDADTLIADEVDELLLAARQTRLVATNFSGWTTMQKPVSTYLQEWLVLANKPGDTYQLEDRIGQLLANPFPAVNSGVFAIGRSPRLLGRWDRLTWMARGVAHPDEISLQLMLFETPHQILGYQYNCHPYSYRREIGVRIWHFAGRSHLSFRRCREVWLPAYRECIERNVANIKAWSHIGPHPPGGGRPNALVSVGTV